MQKGINRFLTILSEEKRFSNNTITAYKNDLSQLAEFLKVHKVADWSNVKPSYIMDYFINLREKSYAPSTTARKVAAVRSFFNYLIDENIAMSDPTEGLSRPHIKKTPPKMISAQDIEELLKQTRTSATPESKRDEAMLELLCATGVRVSELVAINMGDINIDVGCLRCFGKNGKERYIDFHIQAANAVSEYINDARKKLVHNNREAALFLNRRGERLTRQGFWLILKSYAEKAKIKAKITPHSMRHSTALHSLASGKMNLRELQQFLGHANISTTQIYEKAISAGE